MSSEDVFGDKAVWLPRVGLVRRDSTIQLESKRCQVESHFRSKHPEVVSGRENRHESSLMSMFPSTCSKIRCSSLSTRLVT